MFEIEKIFHFEAGHTLEHHDGQCHGPHGHSYILHVIVQSRHLISSGPKKNMIIDFADINTIVKPMIETYFDHQWINETLQTDSPTVEFMSKWIFDYLEPLLPGLAAITLYETATSKATYYKGIQT